MTCLAIGADRSPPVLPATWTPGICAFLPVPLVTTLVIIVVRSAAICELIGRLITSGSVWSITVRSGARTESTR